MPRRASLMSYEMRSESGMHATAVIASTSSADELCVQPRHDEKKKP
jgi:hypothetical protein